MGFYQNSLIVKIIAYSMYLEIWELQEILYIMVYQNNLTYEKKKNKLLNIEPIESNKAILYSSLFLLVYMVEEYNP
jgi:hypothetical protein